MMFEATLRIGEPVVELQQDEDGNSYEAQIIAPVVMLLPVGPNQFAPIQTGILRLPMDKHVVANLATALSEANDNLKNRPGASGIQLAGSMSEAEQLAQAQRQFGG